MTEEKKPPKIAFGEECLDELIEEIKAKRETSDPKPLKIVFEEGCFDELIKDGMTQEKLDEIKAKILEIASDPERLKAASRPLSETEEEALLRAVGTRKPRH